MRFFKSQKHVHCQIIDDTAHQKTVVYAATGDRDIKQQLFEMNAGTESLVAARILGEKIARGCKEKGINIVKLDLGRYGPRQGCNHVNPRLGIAMEACREQGITLIPKRGLGKGHSKSQRQKQLIAKKILQNQLQQQMVNSEISHDNILLANDKINQSDEQNYDDIYSQERQTFFQPRKKVRRYFVDDSEDEDIFGNKIIIDEDSLQVEDIFNEQLNSSKKIYLASGSRLQRIEKSPPEKIQEQKITQKLEHLRKITSPKRRLKSEYRQPVKKLEKELRIEWDQNIKKYRKNFGGKKSVIETDKFNFEDGSDYGVEFADLVDKIQGLEVDTDPEPEEHRRRKQYILSKNIRAQKMLEKPIKLLGEKGHKKKAREIVKKRAKEAKMYDNPNRDMVVMGAGYSSASLVKKEYKK